jgi:glycosyltransferase involved in cell wall biosynthesis
MARRQKAGAQASLGIAVQRCHARCLREVPQVVPPHEWLPGGKLRLMFIGRLDRNKGIENLLEGLVQLQSMETVLDIYGSGDSRYSAELAGLVRYLGLTDRVTFRGFVEGEAKHDAFLSADICVVPSHSENFAMVVAEALAHGVPVIASKGTPWQAVEEVGCGLWVENAPDSLAAAIMRMRGLPLGEMGERGRAWMQQSYSWDNIAREMNAAYRELMGSHASSLT